MMPRTHAGAPSMLQATRMHGSFRRANTWVQTAVTIKRHGEYAPSRIIKLQKFSESMPLWRVLGVLLLTPAPSLIITMLFDSVPLNTPSAGTNHNQNFFVRLLAMYVTLCALLLQQFCAQVGPGLPMMARRLAIITLLTASINTAFGYLAACAIGFPVPFTMQLTAPIQLLVQIVALGISWRKHLVANPRALSDIVRGMYFFISQASMVVVYPLYYYVFTLLPDNTFARPAFLFLLPVIRTFYRVLFQRVSRNSGNGGELIPLLIVFNVDTMGGMFVAFCMQFKPSLLTAVGIAFVKVVMATISFRDLYQAVHRLLHLRHRIKLVKGEVGSINALSMISTDVNLLHEAIALIDRINKKEERSSLIESADQLVQYPARVSRWDGFRHHWFHGTQVVPIAVANLRPIVDNHETQAYLEHRYARRATKLLYMTEFMILVEYVEVIIPAVYSLYLSVIFNLPNRVYYTQFAGMDIQQLEKTVTNVVLYAMVELVSLIAVHLTLRRTLGISPIHQLAFVLSNESAHVQSALILWVVYSTQASLAHYGNDYSFKFAWIQRNS